MSILDTIERALFGASAAETVELRIQLAEQRIMAAIEALDDESEEDDSATEDGETVAEPH